MSPGCGRLIRRRKASLCRWKTRHSRDAPARAPHPPARTEEWKVGRLHLLVITGVAQFAIARHNASSNSWARVIASTNKRRRNAVKFGIGRVEKDQPVLARRCAHKAGRKRSKGFRRRGSSLAGSRKRASLQQLGGSGHQLVRSPRRDGCPRPALPQLPQFQLQRVQG